MYTFIELESSFGLFLLLLLLTQIVMMDDFHEAHGYLVELEMHELRVGNFAVDLHERYDLLIACFVVCCRQHGWHQERHARTLRSILIHGRIHDMILYE